MQVCALQWNKHEREILSSHGFSQNQLCLWRYPSMTKVAEFTVRALSPPLALPPVAYLLRALQMSGEHPPRICLTLIEWI